jgi:TonB family protein
MVNDAAGVAVNVNGSQLMHRSPVAYPPEALAKGIEGTVVVQVKLDANGEVSDATVLSGPDELRKAVLQSVLTWHFEKSAALSTRTVNIDFVKPANSASSETTATDRSFGVLPNYRTALPAGASGQMRMAPAPPAPPPPPTAGKLDHIVVTGLSDSARSELLSSLPIQEGGEWTGQMFAAVKEAATKFDSHLSVGLARSAGGELTLNISVPNSGITFRANNVSTPVGQGSGLGIGIGSGGAAAPLPTNGVYSVGNGVLPPSLLSKIDPVYPEGEPAGTAATVILSIVVGANGMAENINVVKSADPNFDANAVAAVQQWVFKPGMYNGVPVKVKAQIEVNFRKL